MKKLTIDEAKLKWPPLGKNELFYDVMMDFAVTIYNQAIDEMNAEQQDKLKWLTKRVDALADLLPIMQREIDDQNNRITLNKSVSDDQIMTLQKQLDELEATAVRYEVPVIEDESNGHRWQITHHKLNG